jgi:uncharacterized protein (TIGR02001 family)
VIARAAPADSRAQRCVASHSFARGSALFLAGLLLTTIPVPATAQVGAVLSLFSDNRFRGYSLSDGRPVGILDLSYDHPSGLYGTLSGSVVASRHNGLRPLRLAVNAGYATRFRSGLTVDLGAVHSHYSEYSGVASGRSYTEFYAGLSGKVIGGRVSISPNYLGVTRATFHGAVNGHVELSPKWLLDGEVGLLVPIGSRGYSLSSRPQLDARAGIARRLGTFTLHAAVTGRTKGPDIYSGHEPGRTAFVVGISSAL